MENKGANRNWKAKEVRHDRLLLHSYVLYFCSKTRENSMTSKKDVHTHRYTSIFLSFWKVYYFNIFIFFILTVKKESPQVKETKQHFRYLHQKIYFNSVEFALIHHSKS